MNGGLRKGSIFLCESSVQGLLFGDLEGYRKEGSENGCVRSLGTLRDGGLRGRICLFTGNSERWRAQGMDMSVHWEL